MSVDYFTCDICNHPSDDWYGKHYVISGIEFRVCHDCITKMIDKEEIVHIEDFDTDELLEFAGDYGEENIYRFTSNGRYRHLDRLVKRVCDLSDLAEKLSTMKE